VDADPQPRHGGFVALGVQQRRVGGNREARTALQAPEAQPCAGG
jgi:hypothetical protein